MPHAQVLLDRQAGEDAAAFGNQRNTLSEPLVGRHRGDRLAFIDEVATGERERARQCVESGGLARAVGTDQAHQFALVELEVDALTAWMPP